MNINELKINNKLIAEFMGVAKHTSGKYAIPFIGIIDLIDCKYFKSWDWIMPVVDKIESLGFVVSIKGNVCSIGRDNKFNHDSNIIISEFGDKSKIEKLYECILFFIKWYNKNE